MDLDGKRRTILLYTAAAGATLLLGLAVYLTANVSCDSAIRITIGGVLKFAGC